jgi:hypothetical protein
MKLNADTSSFATDAAFTEETDMGKLLQGSELPDPETQTVNYLSGHQRESGSTLAGLLRIDGRGHAWLATLQEAKSPADGSAPTDVYIRVYNRSKTAFTQYGPCKIHAAYEKGATAEPDVSSTVVRFNCAGDSAEEMMAVDVVVAP